WTRRFLTEADFDAVTRAIKAAEARTSAEIRVHLERRGPRRPLGGGPPPAMTRPPPPVHRPRSPQKPEPPRRPTDEAVEDRRFAVVGDEGIHGRVGDPHWQRVRDLMADKLRANAPREAIEHGVAELGRALAEHYPRRRGDTNELSDEVSVS